MTRPNMDVDGAMEAVNEFIYVRSLFGDKGIGGPEWNQAFAGLHPFALAYIPLPEGRVVDENPLDIAMPSFWHACCYVLYRWTLSTLKENEEYFGLEVFRGQARDWPLMPTAWRQTHFDATATVGAFQTFLESEIPINLDPTFACFDSRSSSVIEGIAQHHGLPTNLLDFTFDPVVALYFAGGRSNSSSVQTGDYGLVYSTPFTNFTLLEVNRNPLRLRMELLPPTHAPRMYQQSGLFLDCGAPDLAYAKMLVDFDRLKTLSVKDQLSALQKATAVEILRACKRIYFNRSYPYIDGFDEVFGEIQLLDWTTGDKPQNPFSSSTLASISQEWYASEPVIKLAIDALRDYARKSGADFNHEQAFVCMQAASKLLPRPWDDLSNESPIAKSVRVAEYLATAVTFVSDAAQVYSRTDAHMAINVVRAFVERNRSLFAAAQICAPNLDVFGLPAMINSLIDETLDGADAVLGDVLDVEMREVFLSLLPIWDK